MKMRPLTPDGPEISEISIGTSGIGGPNWLRGVPHGWPEVDLDAVTEAIRLAIDAGVNHFDTADLYGNGNAERRLCAALKKIGLRSEDFVIASKVGYLSGSAPHPFDPFHIKRQCEQSLRNLERDYLDLYYLHNADFGPGDIYLEPAAEALNELVAEGKIRLKGQSAYTVSDFEKTIPVVQPAVLQSRANCLHDQFIAPGSALQKIMTEQRLSCIAFSPMAQGLLAGVFDPENPPVFGEGDVRTGKPQFQAEYLRRLAPRLEQVQERFGRGSDILAAVCIRFVLCHANVAGVIHGFQGPEAVRSNLHAVACALTDEDVEWLREVFVELRESE